MLPKQSMKRFIYQEGSNPGSIRAIRNRKMDITILTTTGLQPMINPMYVNAPWFEFPHIFKIWNYVLYQRFCIAIHDQ